MTDHEVVARKAYANVSINDGTPINPKVMFGVEHSRTMIPSVGLVYKINTDGLDVHVPWITPYLKGHYNNGMGGDEWIAESIPECNYNIDSIEIGPDTLHESEMVTFDNIETVKERILSIINKRKERLELFETAIESVPDNKRLTLDSSKIEILKSIYKLNGIMDIDIDTFVPKSTTEYLDYLMAVTYVNDKENIDFTTLSYIQGLRKMLGPETTIEDIVKKINSDLNLNEEKKESFVARKIKTGEVYTTKAFDNKNAMYLNILKQLNSKINAQQQEGNAKCQTVDPQQLNRESSAEQMDTDAKDRMEREMKEQMRNDNRGQQPHCQHTQNKTHSTGTPESFRSGIKFEMTPEQYKEILDRHANTKEMPGNSEKKETEQVESGVK